MSGTMIYENSASLVALLESGESYEQRVLYTKDTMHTEFRRVGDARVVGTCTLRSPAVMQTTHFILGMLRDTTEGRRDAMMNAGDMALEMNRTRIVVDGVDHGTITQWVTGSM